MKVFEFMTTMTSWWKELLDEAKDLETADKVVSRSISEGKREDLLMFLGALFEEFSGPDPTGGEAGTLKRMGVLYWHLSPVSREELEGAGINPASLRSYLSQR
jgi:hypothetical protein